MEQDKVLGQRVDARGERSCAASSSSTIARTSVCRWTCAPLVNRCRPAQSWIEVGCSGAELERECAVENLRREQVRGFVNIDRADDDQVARQRHPACAFDRNPFAVGMRQARARSAVATRPPRGSPRSSARREPGSSRRVPAGTAHPARQRPVARTPARPVPPTPPYPPPTEGHPDNRTGTPDRSSPDAPERPATVDDPGHRCRPTRRNRIASCVFPEPDCPVMMTNGFVVTAATNDATRSRDSRRPLTFNRLSKCHVPRHLHPLGVGVSGRFR